MRGEMNTHCKHMIYVHDIIIFVVVVVLCNKKFNTKVSLNMVNLWLKSDYYSAR